jgi:hypothetical protein
VAGNNRPATGSPWLSEVTASAEYVDMSSPRRWAQLRSSAGGGVPINGGLGNRRCPERMDLAGDGRPRRQIGGALFERSSRRVTLTPLGEQLRAEVAPAHAALSRALRHAQESARGTTGSLRIGFTITTGGYLLNRLVRQFEAARRPGGSCRGIR